PPLPANTARVYLNMEDDDISGMTLHVWNDATCDSFAGNDTSWDAGLPITGTSETYGGYWDIATKEGSKKCINFIPHRGEEKPLVENTQLDLEAAASIGNVAFTFEGSSTVYYTPMTSLPSAVMSGASAHWLTPDVMALPAGASTVELLYAKEAGIEYDSGSKAFKNVDTVISGEKTDNQSWVGSFPHLANLESWELDLEGLDVKNLLKGQLIAVAYDSQGAPELITQVQPAGVLDAIYTGDGGSAEAQSYGAIITDDNKVDFTLWAPTAQSVSVVKYNSEKVKQASLPMTFNELSGAWRISSDEFEFGDYFRYLIKVYHPVSQEVMEYEVTDPYSLSLSMNSEFSQVVDLNDPRLKPDEWDALQRPIDQTNPGQFVIYEAHVRDFSALDESTNEAHRGKFTAFTQPDTVPVDHLKSLSASGVTHLHLLPIFDIATINENPDEVANIDEPFSKLCDVNPSVKESKFKAHCESDSLISEVFTEIKAEDSAENPVVQELNSYVASTDSFNWGYDPFHYTVPEGSYATDAEGTVRIKELREAVMSIKQYIGMNVVMDVVYNHTNSAGPHARTSVLDKVVPWYYQRLNPVTGGVETSTCCSNTAPERAMFEKMITDSLVVWSQDYKIDSFRFDLMGHHPLDQMERSLQAVKKVDPNTYFYGEGWDFGEVAGNALFTQATQPNLGGTGIGSFSDRLRDAVRGGSPFDSGEGIRRTQGFGNGIYVKTNDLATANDETKQLALHYADLTRLGMAG
ncbi:pullulanase-type alpha-1,6-glucosidase, partial [Photobacterium sanctipauli]